MKSALLILMLLTTSTHAADVYRFSFEDIGPHNAEQQAAQISADQAQGLFNNETRRPWKILASGFFLNQSAENERVSSQGLLISGQYALTSSLRANALVGPRALKAEGHEADAVVFGLEAGFYPLKVRLGRGLTAGLLLGANTWHKANGNPLSIHVGTQVGIALSPRAGVMTTARANLGHILVDSGFYLSL